MVISHQDASPLGRAIQRAEISLEVFGFEGHEGEGRCYFGRYIEAVTFGDAGEIEGCHGLGGYALIWKLSAVVGGAIRCDGDEHLLCDFWKCVVIITGLERWKAQSEG